MENNNVYPLELTIQKRFEYFENNTFYYPKVTLSLTISQPEIDIEKLRGELQNIFNDLLSYY